MVATKLSSSKKYLKLFLGLPLLFSKSYAQLEKGRTKVKWLFNGYKQTGSLGKQVYDGSGKEDVTAYEPAIFIDHQLNEKTNLNAQIVFDVFTNASDTKLDAGTGASGGEGIGWQTRYAGNFGAAHEFDKYGLWKTSIGFSKEWDYKSLNATLGTEQLYADDNFTLGVNAKIYKDEAKLMDVRNGTYIDGKHRNIYALNLSFTQLITKDDILHGGTSSIKSSGNLEGISNTVDVNGVRYEERLPDDRNRQSLFVKWIHAFKDDVALHVKYRYYSDDWELFSNTVETSIFKSLSDDDAFIEFSYRFYKQDRLKYYQDSFDDPVIFMTSDSDMQEFNAHRLGVHYERKLKDREVYGFALKDLSWVLAYYNYTRENKLKYNIAQTSLALRF